MIAGLSKAVVVFLAPVLMLTSILLSLFAFLAPTLMLEDRVALMTVTPSTVITQDGKDEDVNGPSVFFGVLGSCSRPSNDADMNCTLPTVNPVYDLTRLPGDAPQHLLTAPPASSASFIAVALAFSAVFFFTFTLISLRHKMGEKMAATLDKPMIQRFSAWLGFIGFMIGLTSFLIIRMWFDKAVDDFNNSIKAANGPDLIASIGNAFTMVWVAYAFYGVPLIASLAKINVTATKA